MSDFDAVDMPLAEFQLGFDPRTRIAKNFRLYELTKSETAARLLIDNNFRNVEHLRSAVHVCRAIMQPARDHFGRFTPNSVYRTQALERAIKQMPLNWSSTSQHARGEAVDFEIPGVSNMALAMWIKDKIIFDDLILECHAPDQGINSGWVHCSTTRSVNRMNDRSFIYSKTENKYVYVDGLRDSVV